MSGPKFRYLKSETLAKLGACRSQRRLFRKLFGKRVAVTERNLMPYAQHFDIWWGADNLLSPMRARQWHEFTIPITRMKFLARHVSEPERQTLWRESDQKLMREFIRLYTKDGAK